MKDRMPWKLLLHLTRSIVSVFVVLVTFDFIIASVSLNIQGVVRQLFDLLDSASVSLFILTFAATVGMKIVYRLSEADVTRSVLRKALAARNRILKGHGQVKEAQQVNDIAISVTYLKRVKLRNSQLGTILLISAAVFYGLVHVFELGAIDNLVMAPLALYLLLLLKEGVLEFRIKTGLFGTNAYEARTMISFLLDNAVDTDFTDGSGKPKRALLPEKLSEQTPGAIPAQEART